MESREEPAGSRSSQTTESSRAEGGALLPKGGATSKEGQTPAAKDPELPGTQLQSPLKSGDPRNPGIITRLSAALLMLAINPHYMG